MTHDTAHLVFGDADSEVWKERLSESESQLVKAIQAVGRIEVVGHSLDWLGTGWLVGPDIIVTNRHVAAEFGQSSGDAFVYRQSLGGGDMSASVDFLEELDSADSRSFGIKEILHIEPSSGPDLAFLRVEPSRALQLAQPITLAAQTKENDSVAVIGYPARDSRIPDQALMDQIFGQVYNKKRLAPGRLTRLEPTTIRHDCSTLGGSSGSVVVSLDTGEAVGLHFAGRFLEANFAVPSAVVGERLDQVVNHRSRNSAAGRQTTTRPEIAAAQPTPTGCQANELTYVIPIKVTIEVGAPLADPVPDAGSHPPAAK